MKVFFEQLSQYNPSIEGRKHIVYVPYDQLTDGFGPLAEYHAAELAIIMIESSWKGNRRNYHKQKLAVLLSSSRHFALEQAKRGVHVIYRYGEESFGKILAAIIDALSLKEVMVMRPAERELRVDLAPLLQSGRLRELPHSGWLSQAEDLDSLAGPPWKMGHFYQKIRKRTGYLMEAGAPVGGKYSFDDENQLPWKGEPSLPAVPVFTPDEITQEVGDLIESHYAEHWGVLDLGAIPASLEQVAQAWAWAKESCLYYFGPYEDAMTFQSGNLFHTRLSTLLNLQRISAKRAVEEVIALDIPLNSKEGFVRQVLGWREFMYRIHEKTDGFRDVKGTKPPVLLQGDEDRGSLINFLSADQPLIPAFWGRESGLKCLDITVGQVFSEGYTHHIPRLMVLSNIATLLRLSPREVNDWFWVAFTDAYEWVVEPNVLGMGLFATGELLSTKPYISGSGYIHRMSDYCSKCAFHPKKTCPITSWYWFFLEQNQEKLQNNFRLKMILRSLQRRSGEKKKQDQEIYQRSIDILQQGNVLKPADIEV